MAVLLGLLLGASVAACTSRPAAPSVWPPDDFRLVVEEFLETATGPVCTRRFTVAADGLCLYERSGEPLVDPLTKTSLPVFRRLSAYRLLPQCVRQLARKLYRRKVLDLDLGTDAGERRDRLAAMLRLSYRAFGNARIGAARGQVHGVMVSLLNVVNAYLPPGEAFRPPGLVGDPEPANLKGVPAPVDDLAGALAFHEQLLAQRTDVDLLVDAFALACAASERAKAEALLQRWTALNSAVMTADAPFEPPRLSADLLRRLLPP